MAPRLGDGINGSIAEYWELLFDMERGYWKEEIQDEYEASGSDLLIINSIEIRPRFRGTGVGPAVINKTVDIFGPVCGLVACKPWPLQFSPAFLRDRKALKRLKPPPENSILLKKRKRRARGNEIGWALRPLCSHGWIHELSAA